MLNMFHCIGNVAQPKFGMTQNQKPSLRFSVAIYNGKEVDPLWANFTAYGETAERHRELEKGTKVYVEGRYNTYTYVKGEQNVTRTEFIVSKIITLSKGKGNFETPKLVNQQILPDPEPFEDLPF